MFLLVSGIPDAKKNIKYTDKCMMFKRITVSFTAGRVNMKRH